MREYGNSRTRRGSCFYLLGLLGLLLLSSPANSQDYSNDEDQASAEAIATPATATGVCGNSQYRITLCFPGTPQNATCTYTLQSNATTAEIAPHSHQTPCQQEAIFETTCLQMTGLLYVAFGPCNSVDVPDEPTANNTLSVDDWMETLGLSTLEVLGGLFVRGYAYQQSYPVEGLNLFPALTVLKPPSILQLDGQTYPQVTFSGVPIPPLPLLGVIPFGLSILNSPDVNFSGPPRLPLLTAIGSGISIAGCNNLRSLAGLENLLQVASLSKIQIIYNSMLSDISALSDLFGCTPDGDTNVPPDIIIGTISTHPEDLQGSGLGCVLNTPRTVCQYIYDSSVCPTGTERTTALSGNLSPNQLPPAASPGPSQPPSLPTIPSLLAEFPSNVEISG